LLRNAYGQIASRDAVVSGSGAPVTSGTGDVPVTSASERRR